MAITTRGEEIAIIGSGCRFPGDSSSPSKFWEALREPELFASKVPSLQGFYHKDGQYHGHANVQEAYLLKSKGEGDSIHRRFDAAFFGLSPSEAHLLDPQVRLLLEVVYEALENGGQTIDQLRGSDTAVYAGQMVGDYELQMYRDHENFGKYHATGTSRAMLSNRVSYFFDWHGPSMTIDTACSSSLVALHHAVQQLRRGESQVAIVAGSNLIYDSGTFIAETNLQMLSPDGRSRMWDADANGYARGEGVAAVVLKTRAAAERDGDHIECIIRETAVNQDGRTRGQTMPSATAQAQLIRECYARAGLDLGNPADRPQYFEAHGTGTPAGDPIEAEAISTALFGPEDIDNLGRSRFDPLFVGSCKTVIGHTEGTAGIAGVMKASLAIQHATIPPNLLFKRLNPQVQPFYEHLAIPKGKARPWPAMAWEGPRRASVNCFGFGGTNAHAILESYEPPPSATESAPLSASLVPFIFSATSEFSLKLYLEEFVSYLRQNNKVAQENLGAISHALAARRTRLPVTATVAARTAKELASKIERLLASAQESPEKRVGTRITRQDDADARKTPPQILGVFTGQGAQWAQMGVDLITTSPAARRIMATLQEALDRLPASDRPEWSIVEELSKDTASTRIMTAALSQPLCTAIQIVQVDLFRATGLGFSAVVGHSSGEIAAAYAAGFISAEDAICIAYYRGLYSDLAQGYQGQKGAMMAVGTSPEDAQDLLNYDEFQGRACIAAINSNQSVTLSGDADAIDELAVIFEDEQKFARILKVDKAYHSHHMKACSERYLAALEALNIQVLGLGKSPEAVRWFSSATRGRQLEGGWDMRSLRAQYWDDNMVKPVHFMAAVYKACCPREPFDFVVELGPHPALKGPTLETIKDQIPSAAAIPYTGLFQRGASGITSFAEGLGALWTHLDPGCVDLQSFNQFASGTSSTVYKPVAGLPTYAWDHRNEYWHESRYARAVRLRSDTVHELLGHLTPDSTEHDMRWRHVLRPSEVSWLAGHRLQNGMVFPAAGYIVSVLEAAVRVGNQHTKDDGRSVRLIELSDLEIVSALMFENDNASVETILSLTNISRHKTDIIQAEFKYHAAPAEGTDELRLKASGRVRIQLGDRGEAALLPPRMARPSNLTPVRKERFYDSIAELGYGYSGPFKALDGIERKLGAATGFIEKLEKSSFVIHPAVLDAAFHSAFITYAAPGDGSMTAMHVPRRIQRLTINPDFCALENDNEANLAFDAVHSRPLPHPNLVCDVSIYPSTNGEHDHGMVQIQGLECVPFSPPTAQDDKSPFYHLVWDVAEPDVGLAVEEGQDSSTHLVRVVKQIIHRLPHMHILELGSAETADSSQVSIVNELEFKFLSYTIAPDPASADDTSRADLVKRYKGKLAFKDLVHSKTLKEQGFVEASYNLVVAPYSLLGAEASEAELEHLEEVLRNVRRLLKSGGFLVVLDTVGEKETEWTDLLHRTGFSGIGSSHSSDDTPVSVSQAVDDKVTFLRSPLSTALPSTERLVQDLVILSGTSEKTAALVRQISTALKPFCDTIRTAESCQRFLEMNIPPSTIVVSIADLDTDNAPLFQDLTSEKWATLKKMALHAGTLLCVTQGRRAHNPHANMVVGFLRGAARDNPALDYLLLDIENSENLHHGNVIAETLLRHRAASQWRHHADLLQLTMENELVLDHKTGRMLIPRLVVSQEMSDRYNSNGREIHSLVRPSGGTHEIGVVDSAQDRKWDVSLQPPQPHVQGDFVRLETTYSLLSPVRVAEFGCMFVVLGIDQVSGGRHLALSTTNNSAVKVPTRLSILMGTELEGESDERRFLWLTAHCLLARIALRGLSEDDSVLVHGASSEFASVMVEQAALLGVRVRFTTTSTQPGSEWTVIHPAISDGALECLVSREDVSAFIDLTPHEESGPGSIGQRISAVLPVYCRREKAASLFGRRTFTPRASHMEDIHLRLDSAIGWAAKAALAKFGETIPTVTLASLHNSHNLDPCTVIDWTTSTSVVPVKACPVDSLVSFPNNRTYWLVGLTGGLGLSLCEWMVQRGARHFAISSRSPNVEARWLDFMAAKGVTVKVAACDVTQKEHVELLHHEISSSMPPIAGVAQGVMILEDKALQDMTMDQLLTVTKPKVEGSIHLHNLFQDNTLDFFIFFSSVSTVVGNHGQANYAAANSFMSALAEQRRSQGLAASVMDIGPIGGIGYISRAFQDAALSSITMRTSGFTSTSERDFHQLFGEAVLAGRPGAKGPIELVSGLRSITIQEQEENQPVWYSWPRMSHLIQTKDGLAAGIRLSGASGDEAADIPVSTRLAKASDDEIFDIVWDAFTSQLSTHFQLDTKDASKAELAVMRFDQMGIDSLTAVEIRGWFVKTLDVNIPVLKILNGGSIGELVTTAAETIRSRRVPVAGDGEEGSEASATSQEMGDSSNAEDPTDNSDEENMMSSKPSSVRDFEADQQQVILKSIPVSFTQARFYPSGLFLEDKVGLNHTAWAKISGVIDPERLRQAVRAIGEQHEILRTAFFDDPNTGKPMQHILATSLLHLEQQQIESEEDVTSIAMAIQKSYIYDVARGETMRVLLLSRSAEENYLITGVHPLIMDATGIQVFLRWLAFHYTNTQHPSSQLQSRPVKQFSTASQQRHADYAAGKFEAEWQYWRREFATPPPPLPLLTLSHLQDRPSLKAYENITAHCRIGMSTKRRINEICRRQRTTPFHFYLAALRALLLRYCPTSGDGQGGGEDVTTAVAENGRGRDADEMEVIGPLYNLVLVRLVAELGTRFDELLDAAREKTYQGLANSNVPYAKLVEELGLQSSAKYTPFFQVFADYRTGQRETVAFGNDNELVLMGFDLNVPYDVYLDTIDEPDGDCAHCLFVRKDLFDQAAADRLAASYQVMIEAFAREPGLCVGEVEL